MLEKKVETDQRKESTQSIQSNGSDLFYASIATRKVLQKYVGDKSLLSISKRMTGHTWGGLRKAIRGPDRACNPTVMLLTDFANAIGCSAEDLLSQIGREIDLEHEKEKRKKREEDKNK